MLGIYIHIPFCQGGKCNYCDFVSTGETGLIPGYMDALAEEITLTGKMYAKRVDSVYIGGGTPGSLEGGRIGGLMETLRAHFDVSGGAEITIETNPSDVDEGKLGEYRRAGINRLSMGMQAAQDELLTFLGRRHTVEQFDDAFHLARGAGFDNINVDLIYAIPGQGMDDWRDSLNHVMYLKPEHISAYALKIEPGTPFGEMLAKGGLEPVGQDADADMYQAAREILTSKGFINYEISNFARFGRECAHNMKYWRLGDYLGLGVAAHSNIDRLRFCNTDDTGAYIGRLGKGEIKYASSQFVGDAERKAEYVMLTLRILEGFSLQDYRDAFGEDFEKTHADELEEAVLHGLAAVEDGRVRPTPKGYCLQNRLVLMLTGNM